MIRPPARGTGDPTGISTRPPSGCSCRNISPYAGYGLMLQMGIRVDRRKIEQFGDRSGTDTNALTFISIQAGLGSALLIPGLPGVTRTLCRAGRRFLAPIHSLASGGILLQSASETGH